MFKLKYLTDPVVKGITLIPEWKFLLRISKCEDVSYESRTIYHSEDINIIDLFTYFLNYLLIFATF